MKVAILGPVGKDYIKVDDEGQYQIGSIVYYTGVAMKNLGISVTAFATFHEKDREWITGHFQGIDLRHIPDDATLEVHSEFSSTDPDFRESIIAVPAEGIMPETNEFIRELQAFDFIILGPLFHTNISYDLISKLKDRKIIYGNFGMFSAYENGKWVPKFPEKLINVLPFLDYVFLDVNEGRMVSGKSEPQDINDFFQKNGAENLILTQGSKGSHVFIKNKQYNIPAFPPKQLADPTGAGDTYVAGFVKALELFDDPQKQGQFAAMAATISLEKRGAFDGNIDEVLSRLKEYATSRKKG